jgi:GR25 family glycosyltransferase involved in LPS biosynthesis
LGKPRTYGDINEVFPHKVCISLARRADRWERMQKKFELHDIKDVRRFLAVDGQSLTVPAGWSSTQGAFGCLLSHLQVVSEARELGLPNVLIFEDDAVFDTRLQDNFSNYFSQVPADWDMLHFGAMHMNDPIEISENVHRIGSANSTYAYALNHTIFDAFIELNSRAETAVDVNNRVLQTAHACYCFTPYLAWVEDDSSDAQERQKYHWYLKESLVIHGSGMDHLLKHTSLVIAYRNPTRNNSIRQNLLFLTRFYSERLGISVVIVEQNAEPTITVAELPSGSQYFLLPDDGPLNKGRCFNIGMNSSDPKHTFIIFSDSDIFVEEWDIRGNLRMCQQCDCATGFRSIVELTSAATLKLQSNRPMLLTPWFNAEEYSRSNKNDPFGQFCVFNRRSLEAAGGWEEQHPEDEGPVLSSQARQQLRVFESPNDALRLLHD